MAEPQKPVSPDPLRSSLPALGLRAVLVVVFVAALIGAFFFGRSRSFEPRASTSRVVVQPSPNVVTAVHDLARLEATSYHMERVVELTDEQTKLFGLVQAKDAILLVAVGDVKAGVDLGRISADDAKVDWPARRVRLVVPAPEVFSAALDNQRTHVFSRSTDHLASRNEQLEGKARAEAESSMKKAAVESGILDRARASAEGTLRALLKSMGFIEIELVWQNP